MFSSACAPPALSRGLLLCLCVFVGANTGHAPWAAAADKEASPKFVDLSLMVAPELPCTWPVGLPKFRIEHYERIGPLSPYNSDVLSLDENTGTQFDSPTHSVAPPDSGLPNAGKFGALTSEKVPAWQFGGEACVIDCRSLFDSTPNGRSDLVTKERIIDWEKKHRPLEAGDVVLFNSGYSDAYYKPFPAGRRVLAPTREFKAPAWPEPDPACIE
jgi:kynurenine formamidase